MLERAESPFREVKSHVLLPWARELDEASEKAHDLLSADLFGGILDAVPDKWLLKEGDGLHAGEKRKVYRDFLTRRLKAAPAFVGEAKRARSELV